MSRTFSIERKPFEKNQLMYRQASITINPGVTVLTGCNGIGKSTLLHTIKQELKNEKIPVLFYDNLTEGGETAKSKAIWFNDIAFAATLMTSSEGEQITANLGTLASEIGMFVRSHASDHELWILLDAIDSGLSVDGIDDVKEFLFETILETTTDKDVFIVVSANEYEMCRNENCFDVRSGKYITFNDYEAYRSFILKTKEQKNSRDHINNKTK